MKTVKIPSILTSLVLTGLTGIDGMEFSLLSHCPFCKGPLKFHDIRAKRFATVTDNDEKRIISVKVTRYYCRDCGKLCYAKAPFYPDTKFGSPVIDLCMTIARIHPYNHTAKILQEIGVVVDRGTIRNFSGRSLPPVSYAEIFGVPVPLSICYLSDLFGRKRYNYNITQEEVLKICNIPLTNEVSPSSSDI